MALLKRKYLKKFTTVCKDGSITNSKKRPCQKNRGVDRKVKNIFNLFNAPDTTQHTENKFIQMLPIDAIFVDKMRFQNRKAAYSSESTNRIIKAVEEGTFTWVAFDPIKVWIDPIQKKYFVLSGHSRTEAFRILSRTNKDFLSIPAQVFHGSEQDAINFALNSNTLSTPETETERTTYYRRLFMENRKSLKEVKDMIDRNEGLNAKRIKNFIFLDSQGKTFFALESMVGKDATTEENVRNIAQWVGQAREQFPQLSTIHENEIFDYLVSTTIVLKKSEFFDFLNKQIIVSEFTNGGKLDPYILLNLKGTKAKSQSLIEWEGVRNELRTQILNTKKEKESLMASLLSRGLSQNNVVLHQEVQNLTMKLNTLQTKLLKHEQTQNRVQEAEQNQASIFGKRKRKV